MTDQTKPKWPWPGDTDLQKARRLANSTLTMLVKVDPEGAELLMAQAHLYELTWFGPTPVINDPEDAVTTLEAAQLMHVKPQTIRLWACTPHPDPERAAAGETLLRRFKWLGRERTYLVRDLYEAQRLAKRERAANGGEAA